MIAPSEKHLEDWIVANDGNILAKTHTNGVGWRVIGRQIPILKYRADLLVLCHHHLFIMELKKGDIDAKSLAQVLLYKRYLAQIWKHIIKDAGFCSRSATAIMPDCFSGMLVGQSVSNEILIAALGAAVSVYLYDFDGTDYTMRFAGNDLPDSLWMTEPEREEYAYGFIGETMRAIFADFCAHEQTNILVAQDE